MYAFVFLGSLDYENQTYTVEEAVEKLGFGTFQIIVTVFSGLLWVSTYGESPSLHCCSLANNLSDQWRIH